MKKIYSLFLLFSLSSATILMAQDDANFMAGETAFKSGNLPLAKDYYSRYIKTFADKLPDYLKRVHAYDTSNSFEKASLFTGFTHNRAWAVGYYKRGLVELRSGDQAGAENDFDMSHEIDGQYSGPYLQKGLLLKGKGRNEACKYLSMAHWLNDTSKAAKAAYNDNFCFMCANENYVKGKTEVEMKQFAAGLQHLDVAIMYCHDSGNYYTYRGIAYEGLGKLDSAIADYTYAIKHDSGSYMAYYRRALTFEQAQKFREAFADLNKSILINPQFANAYKHQATDCESLSMPEAALYDYQQLLRLKPSEGIAWYKVGMHKKEMGQDACDYFQKALDLGIDDAQSYVDDCQKAAAHRALK